MFEATQKKDNARQYKTIIDILHDHVYTSDVATFVLQKNQQGKTAKTSRGLAHAFY
jgi:hypothetical protein